MIDPDPTMDPLAEALARARMHARRSVAEALAALRALLDAVSLTATGSAGEEHEALRPLARWLERGAQRLAGDVDGGGEQAIFASLSAALEDEIGRWERRAANDADARAVLRALLGLRELLWELGVRGSGPGAASPREAAEGHAEAGETSNREGSRRERMRAQG